MEDKYVDLENPKPIMLMNNSLLYIHQLSNTVRWLSIIDLLLGIFMFFYGYIGIYILVRLICSLSGYYGAAKYKYHFTSIYLGFLVVCAIIELVFIYWYYKLYRDKKITQELLIGGIIYEILFSLLKLYIIRFVCIFNSLTYNLTNYQRKELIHFNDNVIKVIWW